MNTFFLSSWSPSILLVYWELLSWLCVGFCSMFSVHPLIHRTTCGFFFFSQSVNVMNYINFWILNPHWIHCRKIPTCSWSIILLILFYIWLTNIVLTILHLCSRERDLSPVFLWCLWSSHNEWGSIPSASVLWQSFVKFTREPTCACCFLLWKVIVINYWFNLFRTARPIHAISFFLCKFGKTVSFKELVHFI